MERLIKLIASALHHATEASRQICLLDATSITFITSSIAIGETNADMTEIVT